MAPATRARHTETRGRSPSRHRRSLQLWTSACVSSRLPQDSARFRRSAASGHWLTKWLSWPPSSALLLCPWRHMLGHLIVKLPVAVVESTFPQGGSNVKALCSPNTLTPSHKLLCTRPSWSNATRLPRSGADLWPPVWLKCCCAFAGSRSAPESTLLQSTNVPLTVTPSGLE